jgi:hypothetical protein
MSAAEAASSDSTQQPTPKAPDADVQLMQDVLYDILAVGIDPGQGEVPVAEIERFLFEHARAPKDGDAFRAFFAQHGLSVRARVAGPQGLVLPDISRAGDDAMPVSMPADLAPSAPRASHVQLVRGDEVFGADDDGDDLESPTGMHRVDLSLPTTAAARPRGVAWVIAAASLCVVALCASAAWFGYETIRQLRGEVARATEQSRQDRNAIHALQNHAVDLESSVAATGELVQRVDQKSDLLLQTMLNDDKPARRGAGRAR